jgi:hypothetical protein
MKHLKNKLLILFFLVFANGQVFAMGSKPPTISNSTPQAPATAASPSNMIRQILTSLTPMLNLLSPILSSINPIFGLITPMINLVNQLPALKQQSSTANTSAPINKLIPTIASLALIAPESLSASTRPAAQGSVYIDQIETLAINSICADFSWKNKGKAPIDYMKGVTLSYARGLCQLKTKSKLFSVISMTSLNNVLKDTLSNFQSNFTNFGPLNSKELMAVPACNQLLKDVQDLINGDQYACQDI